MMWPRRRTTAGNDAVHPRKPSRLPGRAASIPLSQVLQSDLGRPPALSVRLKPGTAGDDLNMVATGQSVPWKVGSPFLLNCLL